MPENASRNEVLSMSVRLLPQAEQKFAFSVAGAPHLLQTDIPTPEVKRLESRFHAKATHRPSRSRYLRRVDPRPKSLPCAILPIHSDQEPLPSLHSGPCRLPRQASAPSIRGF